MNLLVTLFWTAVALLFFYFNHSAVTCCSGAFYLLNFCSNHRLQKGIKGKIAWYGNAD